MLQWIYIVVTCSLGWPDGGPSSIKTLSRHGNSAALIIDKALLEILNIAMDTPLEIVTDGENLIISPMRDAFRTKRIDKALQKVNARHAGTLNRLAE